MNETEYKRKPGDFEIRILHDGQVVFVAPDESLMEIADMIGLQRTIEQTQTETVEHERNQTS